MKKILGWLLGSVHVVIAVKQGVVVKVYITVTRERAKMFIKGLTNEPYYDHIYYNHQEIDTV